MSSVSESTQQGIGKERYLKEPSPWPPQRGAQQLHCLLFECKQSFDVAGVELDLTSSRDHYYHATVITGRQPTFICDDGRRNIKWCTGKRVSSKPYLARSRSIFDVRIIHGQRPHHHDFMIFMITVIEYEQLDLELGFVSW